jgi:proteasome accessory factor A
VNASGGAVGVRRVVGIETEYGISAPGQPAANPVMLSGQIVTAYARAVYGDRRMRWDYDVETPLRDARGFDMTRADADASQLTDEDPTLANVVLTNGGRLYVDHAHPEYSTPEVMTPLDAVVWDRAGVVVMERAMRYAAATPGGTHIQLYKNNTDNKGASYGTHENYLMSRRTPFVDIVRALTPFFVSRQVFTGAGRLGMGQDGRTVGFQISQRADFFEAEVGLETTLKRPIINTRDEPHADPERFRRLHVIVGDAAMGDVTTYLKIGTTSLVISMLEAGWLEDVELTLRDPVRAMHHVSHDPTLQTTVEMRDGRQFSALDVQEAWLELATKYVEERCAPDDTATRDVLERWTSIISRLREDPELCRTELDWVAKYRLMRAYQERDGMSWNDPRLSLIDLQWADIRPERGLALTLEKRGSLQRLTTPEAVEAAISEPPVDTRAWFRGECLRRYSESVAAASWDSVIFDVAGRPALQRVPTLEPERGTKAHVGGLLDAHATAGELLDALAASS